ncbi:MAG: sporulation protein YunB [Firmicutes bacterium]|nr:sporulation protein YunB [Bacillota bacterium]
MHRRWQPGNRPPSLKGYFRELQVIVSLLLFFLIVSTVIAFWYVDFRVKPVVQRWAQQRGVNIATRAINNAIQAIMVTGIDSADLVHFQKDQVGRIVGVSFEWGKINNIVSNLTNRIQSAINTTVNEEIPVPIGQLTGVAFLAGLGPKIPVRIIPVGAVDTTPKIEFLEKGINQTFYRIYLDVRTSVRIVVPLVKSDVEVRSSIPIVEQWIVGEVPQVYLNWSSDLRELERLQESIFLEGHGSVQ